MRPLAQIADDIIGVKIETARSRYFRIKLAKRARREISGICVNLLPFFYSLAVDFFKTFSCNYYLASDLDLVFPEG